MPVQCVCLQGSGVPRDRLDAELLVVEEETVSCFRLCVMCHACAYVCLQGSGVPRDRLDAELLVVEEEAIAGLPPWMIYQSMASGACGTSSYFCFVPPCLHRTIFRQWFRCKWEALVLRFGHKGMSKGMSTEFEST